MCALGALAFALAACDLLLGLDSYRDVACAFDCGADAGPDAGSLLVFDALQASDVPGSAGGEGSAPGDGATDVVMVPDGGWPIPTAHETWAHWPMPNPDAGIAPGSSTLLPNTMAYDAGADGQALTVYDLVTHLRWSRQALPASDYDRAWGECTSLQGAGWRVPTRIELVSLVDFTQASESATLDPNAFSKVPAVPTWTSSAVAGDDGPAGYWSVDFATGLTSNSGQPAEQVLCVNGGTP